MNQNKFIDGISEHKEPNNNSNQNDIPNQEILPCDIISYRGLNTLHKTVSTIKTYQILSDSIIQNHDNVKVHIQRELKIKQKMLTYYSQYLLIRRLIGSDFLSKISSINVWLRTIIDLSNRYKLLKSYDCELEHNVSHSNLTISCNIGTNLSLRYDQFSEKISHNHICTGIDDNVEKAKLSIIDTLNMFNDLHMNKLIIIQNIWKSMQDDMKEIREYFLKNPDLII